MSDDGVGRRFRAARKLAGLTQASAAQRMHVSTSLVKKVETGSCPASPAFVASAARALDVDAAELLGQPERNGGPELRAVHSLIPPLRREFALYATSDDSPVRPIAELQADVRAARSFRHRVELQRLGGLAPGLLRDLRVAAHALEGHDQQLAFGLLAEVYAAAGQVAYKLGYHDLSSVSTDRVEWAAARSGDDLAVAAGAFYRAGEMINAAQWSSALEFLEVSRRRVEGRTDEGGHSLTGMLHLKSGLAAARGGQRDVADAHLAEAEDRAAHVREGADHQALAFGPENVSIWGVGLAVERLDGTTAVSRATNMAPLTNSPAERVCHHWIDVARGYLLHGDRERSLLSLQRARAAGPQQARHHPQVKETVRVLAERDRRRSDTLAGFARWAGVAI